MNFYDIKEEINSLKSSLDTKTKKVIEFNNKTIRKAVELWIENEVEAIRIYGHISNWNTSNVTDMSKLFKEAYSFNEDIGSWDVSQVKNMSELFKGAYLFNKDIGSWNVSQVKNMSWMFYSAMRFNQDIGSWDVSSVRNMTRMFDNAISFNNAGSIKIGTWNVSNVTNMQYMFCSTKMFNQDIGLWNVSNVTNMRCMFNMARKFNNGGSNSIGSWNISRVIDMNAIFNAANVFNQDIGKWPINSNCNTNCMFLGSYIKKENFEGKLYGNKIAEYFKLDNPNEDEVWKHARWERRKNAVMFFSSISKLNIKDKVDKDSQEIQSDIILNYLHSIDNDIYKEIVLFI